MILISYDEPSKTAKPGECAFHCILRDIPVYHSAVLLPIVLTILPVRTKKGCPKYLEPLSERITVVSLVSDDSLRPGFEPAFPAAVNPVFGRGFFGQSHLRQRRSYN